MTIALRLRKSAGVPVTGTVHRLLSTADLARDRRDWAHAASLYREALEADPSLAHIWVQYGHMLRETGQSEEARDAYTRATELQPCASDPHLHLGHLHKMLGDGTAASRAYLQAVQLDRSNANAVSELHGLMARGTLTPDDLLLALDGDASLVPARRGEIASAAAAANAAVSTLIQSMKRHTDIEDYTVFDALTSTSALLETIEREGPRPDGGQADGPVLVFDISDLTAYFRDNRLPTGIQRVQIETIVNALRAGEGAVRICAFQEHRGVWLEIPPPMFVSICGLSLAEGNRSARDWIVALTKLQLLLTTSETFVFPEGAFLINLGTSWWVPNYFMHVRQVKARHGVRYVPFVHDMIPLMRRDLCPPLLVNDFTNWAIGIFDHADFLFVNSESTRRDVIRTAEYLGHSVDPASVAVIRLDAEFRKPRPLSSGDQASARNQLAGLPYVLYVSTIEPRKNHVRAFEAWSALLRRHGPRKVPRLVCVGHRGWMGEPVHAHLAAHAELRQHVQILSLISDAELAQLYADCLFTLYPTHYEGWGLPVTESLCHGKVPLISDNSSLPEAGGPFAEYFDAESTHDLTAALERLIFSTAFREDRERQITEMFKPRSWSAISAQMIHCVAEWASLPQQPRKSRPIAQVGAYHSFSRAVSYHIWPGMRSTEIYRTGENWWGLDDWGCWTKPGRAVLQCELSETEAPLRVYIKVLSMPGTACPYRIDVNGEAVLEGEVQPNESRWLAIDVDPSADAAPLLEIGISGVASENLRDRSDGNDQRVISLGVAGFFLCRADDAATRTKFLEAVVLDRIDSLSVNREPRTYTPLN